MLQTPLPRETEDTTQYSVGSQKKASDRRQDLRGVEGTKGLGESKMGEFQGQGMRSGLQHIHGLETQLLRWSEVTGWEVGEQVPGKGCWSEWRR